MNPVAANHYESNLIVLRVAFLFKDEKVPDLELEAFASLINGTVAVFDINKPARSISVPFPRSLSADKVEELERAYRGAGWLTADYLVEDDDGAKLHSFHLERVLPDYDRVSHMADLIYQGIKGSLGGAGVRKGPDEFAKTFADALTLKELGELEISIRSRLARHEGWNKVTMNVVDPHTVVYTVTRSPISA